MDNFDPALISVIMPCLNAAPYVEEAVESALGQSYPHVELIVVDDGSTDGSSEILQRLASEHPERITLIYQNRDGPFAARNRALAHANGNYIAFLDADDTWQPDALSRMHDALETHAADIAYCRWQTIGIAATDNQPNIPPELEAGEAAIHFLAQSPWRINSVLIRRHLIDELRGFSERAPTAMDYDLWLRMLARQPRLVHVPDVLAFHRQYPRGESHIPHWRQVLDAVAVRRDFARHHPEFVARITPPPPQRTDLRPVAARSLSLPLAQRHRIRPSPVPPRLPQGRLESRRLEAPTRQSPAWPALPDSHKFCR